MKVQKKIFKGFLRSPVAGCTVLLLLVFAFLAPTGYAQQILHYKTYHPGTGEEFNRFYCTIEKGSSGNYEVHWVLGEDGLVTEEDYILDERFETLSFRVTNIEEETDYTGEKKGSVIFIQGQYKGQKVERAMTIDERPFYYNPKIGLSAFVRTGRRNGKFWGFQNRELKVYPMKAFNKGLDVISVNGEDVEAIKVYWTVDDFRSAFFKRIYWFRASDGLYLKQTTDGGKFRELVTEEGGL
jgi:hypothetical protein